MTHINRRRALAVVAAVPAAVALGTSALAGVAAVRTTQSSRQSPLTSQLTKSSTSFG